MKKHISTALRAGCFLLGFCILFTAVSRLLNDKTSQKYAGYFYGSGEQFEVLFAGSSLALDDVFPLQIYRDTGIVSCNIGMTKEYIAITYWRLVEAFRTQNPKVVVLEVTGAVPDVKLERDDNTLALLHNSLDAMPLGLTKVQALADLFGWQDIDSIADYLFPLSQFHTRYASLTQDDFQTYILEDRGALPLRVMHYDETPLPEAAAQTPQEPSTVGLDYLNRIAQLCAEHGTQLLLAAFPTRVSAEEIARRDAFASLCDQYDNVQYINLFYEDIIDPAIDMSDVFGHLNTSGGGKLTAWLGAYLAAHYDLTDRRGDAACAAAWEQSWNNSLRQHATHIGREGLDTGLMLLKQEGLGWALRLSPAALEQPSTQRLLRNLGLTPTTDGEPFTAATGPLPEGAALPEGENVILAWNADTGEVLAQEIF